jgi:hypothetical protein
MASFFEFVWLIGVLSFATAVNPLVKLCNDSLNSLLLISPAFLSAYNCIIVKIKLLLNTKFKSHKIKNNITKSAISRRSFDNLTITGVIHITFSSLREK